MTIVLSIYDHNLGLVVCWENCELLQSNFQVWGAMCEEKEICKPASSTPTHPFGSSKPNQSSTPKEKG
ncbi:unnamed protein product [Callosobruchus maculatus]|uniref:Uncharacterized protein n=1 Tax=Callosobruchus maculatus TaxID=64391 RepID=A0A653D0Q3_CALMS|nr:unnamed protein product [Callosobruchus maculatus]